MSDRTGYFFKHPTGSESWVFYGNAEELLDAWGPDARFTRHEVTGAPYEGPQPADIHKERQAARAAQEEKAAAANAKLAEKATAQTKKDAAAEKALALRIKHSGGAVDNPLRDAADKPEQKSNAITPPPSAVPYVAVDSDEPIDPTKVVVVDASDAPKKVEKKE